MHSAARQTISCVPCYLGYLVTTVFVTSISRRLVSASVNKNMLKSDLQSWTMHSSALQHTATHCNTLQHTATHSSGFRLKQPKHVYKVCTAQIEQNRYSCLAQTLCAALRGVNTATPTTRHGSEQGGLKSPNRDYSDVTVSAVLHALHWCNLKAAEYFSNSSWHIDRVTVTPRFQGGWTRIGDILDVQMFYNTFLMCNELFLYD